MGTQCIILVQNCKKMKVSENILVNILLPQNYKNQLNTEDKTGTLVILRIYVLTLKAVHED